MDIGVSFGRFGSTALDKVQWAVEADELGFESIWVGESYGSDAFTPLAFIAARTKRIKLGTSVIQLAARSPANTAMASSTLDRLSGGRLLLGLGVSSRMVVQSWHGVEMHPPVPWLRDYVGIVRAAWARTGPLQYRGSVLSVPPDHNGQIRMNIRPLRESIPIYLAANGAATVNLTAEIADGWMPVFFAAEAVDSVYRASLTSGNSGRAGKTPLIVSPVMHVVAENDVRQGIDSLRAETARYLVQDGAQDTNMNVRLARAYGFGAAVDSICSLLERQRTRAEIAAAVPDDLIDAIHLIGNSQRLRSRLKRLSGSGVDRVIGIVSDADTMNSFARSAL